MSSHEPPASDEVEIAVFGPGLGESIAAHIGDGEWVIIDSCRDYATKNPAALDYLEALGVDPAISVKAIIATHWDSDHVRGLYSVVEACTSASFFCTAAVGSEDFEVLLDLACSAPQGVGTRLQEVARTLERRREVEQRPGAAVQLASESTLLLEREATDEIPRRALHALSPSARSVLEVTAEARRALSDPKNLRRRVHKLSRNDTSVALLLRIGTDGVLLGADLERAEDADRGWLPAVRLAGEIGVKASLVKVPHHGSEDAHDEMMWTGAAAERPAATVTPFRSGSVKLPRPSDRERIRGLVATGILTADPEPQQQQPSTLLSLAVRPDHVTAIESPPGAVVWRRRMGAKEEWRPVMGAGACIV